MMIRLYLAQSLYPSLKEVAAKVVELGLDGFTIIETTGYWKGVPEDSAIIEWIGDRRDVKKARLALKGAARWYLREANEESVGYLESPTEVCFLRGRPPMQSPHPDAHFYRFKTT